ncbi:type II toxin-antitoxin system VapC family toxin [Flexivirga lutea]
MIVDTSALIAILKEEPEADQLMRVLASRPSRISASTLLETMIVGTPARRLDVRGLLEMTATNVVPFDRNLTELAATAHRQFGRGSGSPAKLNFGDCFSYALAKAYDEPLLFKGDDFSHTDVRSALS